MDKRAEGRTCRHDLCVMRPLCPLFLSLSAPLNPLSTKLIQMILKNSISTTRKTHSRSIKDQSLNDVQENNRSYSEIETKPINTLKRTKCCVSKQVVHCFMGVSYRIEGKRLPSQTKRHTDMSEKLQYSPGTGDERCSPCVNALNYM